MLTLDIAPIKDEYLKDFGEYEWAKIESQIIFNLSIIGKMIIQSDLKRGLRMSAIRFHALNYELTEWSTDRDDNWVPPKVQANLSELCARYMHWGNFCTLMGKEENLEDIII